MTKMEQLKAALISWRGAERDVLCATNPDEIEHCEFVECNALDELRKIVDSEPWSDIAQGL